MSSPARPVPDDKDWTWVLERPCPECGFDAASVSATEVAERTRAAVAAMHSVLTGQHATQRPRPDVWSALEYGCHVRDVCIVFGARLASMRGTHDPLFADWDQDETALAERYWEQDPQLVAAELDMEGERIADAFDSVRPEEWKRRGRRSNGSVFTVDTLSRYFLHDVVHHVHDVAPERTG